MGHGLYKCCFTDIIQVALSDDDQLQKVVHELNKKLEQATKEPSSEKGVDLALLQTLKRIGERYDLLNSV